MTQEEIERTAAMIEGALATHGITARVWTAIPSPRVVRYDLTLAAGTKVGRVENLTDEIALALHVKNVRVTREGGTIQIEVPRRDIAGAGALHLHSILGKLKNVPPFTGVLGVDTAGAPLLLRVDSPNVAHVLIAGTTGSGKTILTKVLLGSLLAYNRAGMLQAVLIDPKGRGFEALAAGNTWRNLDVIQHPEEVTLVLDMLVAEMERRDRERTTLPRIIVAIDELADLIATGGDVVVGAITRLTQRGREAGIHVIAATQRPSSAVVGGMMKANFPIRLVGAVTSADDARVASGIPGTEAEKLEGRGDFLLIQNGQKIRFQAPMVNDHNLTVLLSAEPQKVRHNMQPCTTTMRRPRIKVYELATTSATATTVATAGENMPLLPETSVCVPVPQPVATVTEAELVELRNLARDGRWRREIPATHHEAVRRLYIQCNRSLAATIHKLSWSYDDWARAQLLSMLNKEA